MAEEGNATTHRLARIAGAVFAGLSMILAAPAQAGEAAALTPELLANYVATSFVSTQERKTLASAERECLARAVYHESRGEPEAGQWAVASVIINRVNSPRYPDSVCDVVFQNAHLRNRCQFSFACDGRPDDGGHGNIVDRESWVKSHLIALAAYEQFLAGETPVEGLETAMHFHTTSVSPSWASAYVEVAAIGNHVFY